MSDFTVEDELEVLERFIEMWRPASSIADERKTYLVLKSMAEKIRASNPMATTMLCAKIERAIMNARKAKKPGSNTYEPGNLREIAELTIGGWPTIRHCMYRYASNANSESELL